MKNMKVENIIIGKQFENCENLQEFINIVNEKNIKIYTVEAENKITIEKGVYFNVLWPDSGNEISEKIINNNSLVCKLIYKDFSMLFTGDIEQIAEEAILKKYANELNANILKVAHHGSKSSSIDGFLKVVKPKIALIGVGKNNIYRHPSNSTLNKLEQFEIQVYRTDENGEISITTNGTQINIKTIMNKK